MHLLMAACSLLVLQLFVEFKIADKYVKIKATHCELCFHSTFVVLGPGRHR